LSGSFCVLTHVPLQIVVPSWQTHWPPLQIVSGTVHVVSHPPQWLMSVCVLTHVPGADPHLSGTSAGQ